MILVGRYHAIEPLGLLYLMGVARECGWDASIHLVRDLNFEDLVDEVCSKRPALVCFSIWTGYHRQAFAACDQIRALGIPVAIGGPHATYFYDDCLDHASWVVRHTGFRMLREILMGQLAPGIHFDEDRGQRFPVPDREAVYQAYPALGQSPIKSIIASVGCPFRCTYCYAPRANRDHGGFELNCRPVDDIVEEARALLHWPTKMVYFQDDIFGFNLDWLAEFVAKWKEKVGLPWHCQIRLELTQDVRRLELFKEGGCTGITLAIESGNDFLRRYVLRRGMPDDLIVEGCRKIQRLGFRLRTEQILAVPFSDIQTDIETLELNCRINPDVAWSSILAPYGGTEMGTIAERFGFYSGNNDDLTETFFDRSVLRHAAGGRRSIEDWVRGQEQHDNPLMRLRAADGDLVEDSGGVVGHLRYLDKDSNNRYADQTVMLHRLFYWLARDRKGFGFARHVLRWPSYHWNWHMIGWSAQMFFGDCYPRLDLPSWAVQNPHYFRVMPDGLALAQKMVAAGIPEIHEPAEQWKAIATVTRHWLYDRALYLTGG